jgi:hypothetical protein
LRRRAASWIAEGAVDGFVDQAGGRLADGAADLVAETFAKTGQRSVQPLQGGAQAAQKGRGKGHETTPLFSGCCG